MTVQKDLVKNIYVGNGGTTQFPITFDVNAEQPGYIHVYISNDDNSTTETKNYTVDLISKIVTYPKSGEPLASGKKLVIMRELPLMQLMDLINQGDYYADDVEQAFDDLTMIAQQLSEKLARAMVFSVEVDTANFSNIIPLAPGMSFRINDEGTGLELTEDPAKVLPQAQNLLQQTTQQANIAINKASAAAESALAAATSESNAGAHENKAQAWAESETSPDGEPTSKSAKTWAGDSADSAELAQAWAESDESPDGETDSESPTSETMSAKEWALYAKQITVNIGNPVVDVTESGGALSVIKADGAVDKILQILKAIQDGKGNNIVNTYATKAELNAKAPLASNAEAHNGIFRGKNLGSSVTAAQWAAIQADTFDDLYIGDYWTINGVEWVIVAFDYYYNTGDTACTTHHVVVIPRTNLYNAQMNESNVTTGAYVGSKMYTTNLNQAKTTIQNAFGASHLLSIRQHFQNATTDGYETGGTWYDATVWLMSEANVYGGNVFKSVINGTGWPNLYSIDNRQYPYFRFALPNEQRAWYWLRDVAYSSHFARVYSDGASSTSGASAPGGVRPAFCIKG